MDSNLMRAYRLREQRGAGQGKGGQRQGDGGATMCVCPSCGHKEAHAKGSPCSGMTCPECGTAMVGEQVDKKKILAELFRTPINWNSVLVEQGPEQLRAAQTKATNNQRTQKPVGLGDQADVTAPTLNPQDASLSSYLPDLQDIKTAVDNLIQKLYLAEPDILKMYATGKTAEADKALDEIASLWNQQIGAYRLWYETSGGKESIAGAPPEVQQIVARFHTEIQKAAEKLSDLNRIKNEKSQGKKDASENPTKDTSAAPTPDELKEKEAELKQREKELNDKERRLLKDREDMLDKREKEQQPKTPANNKQ